MMQYQEPILLQCYLGRQGDSNNRLIFYPSRVQVIHKGKSTVIEWGSLQTMQLQKRKLIIALVAGGIGTSLSMLALPLGWYDYELNLFSIFLFFAVMYWGFVGQKALVLDEKNHQHVFLLAEVNPIMRAMIKRFYQRKRNLVQRPMQYVFHIATRADWEQQNFDSLYQPPSLKTEGFVHCSTADELIKSYQLYFDPKEELVLLAIHPDQLDAEVKWEYVAAREADFPHVLGPIDKVAVHSAIVFSGEGKLLGLLGQ